MNVSESLLDSFFVARQPIFTKRRSVWGYELLFRNSEQSLQAEISDEDAATSQVIADGVGLIQEDIDEGQKLLVNFPHSMLLSSAADLLSPDICVIEILETVEFSSEVRQALSALKEKGYTIALDDYSGQESLKPFLGLVDIIKVDCLYLSKGELTDIAKSLSSLNALILAEKVESNEMFNWCFDLDFDLFQGFFFSYPEIIPGKKMSANSMSRMRLLRLITGNDFDIGDLTSAITLDVSISYRLLRFMNSPTFGIPHTVNSIEQAIALIGYKKLTGWLRVILLSDMCARPDASELVFLSIKRAKFFELLALEAQDLCLSSDSMFMLGLFSMLDVLLGKPMKDLMAELPIGEDLVKALVGECCKNLVWLQLVRELEMARWESVGAILKKHNLPALSIAKTHMAAMQWANEVMSMVRY